MSAGPEDRRPLYGDTHVHTALSFDAYTFGNRNMPDDAYRFAKGEAISHPAGFEMKLTKPLDFAMVSDHGIYLGMLPAMYDPASSAYDHPISQASRQAEGPLERRAAFAKLLPYVVGQVENDDLFDQDIFDDAWQHIIEQANAHYEPGKFTTFVGYEFTASDSGYENLHRNVLFKDTAPSRPLPRTEAGVNGDPEILWQWMDQLRERGIESIAIPHNSNGSNGRMFARNRVSNTVVVNANTPVIRGSAFDAAYVQLRKRNEPVVEMTQVKGTSETSPSLSPGDDWAGFEIMQYQVATWLKSEPKGSYVRDAYKQGLEIARSGIGNPYKFGMIGASDTHVGAGSFDESNYWSKIGLVDATPELRGSIPLPLSQVLVRWAYNSWQKLKRVISGPPPNFGGEATGHAPFGYVNLQWKEWGASGLAGVWAEDNTRESIFAAMRRREVYATSGPRIPIRLFGGYGYSAALLDSPKMIERAYAQGVPMGGDLQPQGDRQPSFLVWAARDFDSAPLQRLQIIKGWIDDRGDTYERVYDVACADGSNPADNDYRCADNNASVDIQTCARTTTTEQGGSELRAHWQDPEFDHNEVAFYYARAIEDPTCRWSTWDAVRAGAKPNPSLETTIQERSWSSPIWYGSH